MPAAVAAESRETPAGASTDLPSMVSFTSGPAGTAPLEGFFHQTTE
jgi:hypothetical protein